MNRKPKNKIACFPFKFTGVIILLLLQIVTLHVFAQETKTATLTLFFSNADSTNTCIVKLMTDSIPVKEVEIHLYVKGMYTLLPVGKVVATDENGEAAIAFPIDLPGDKNNMINVIAKVEKDATYGNIETQSAVKWGVVAKNESYNFSNRSLSASRERAPMFLVIASTLIITIIWGTIFYVVFQLFKIKKSARKTIPIISVT
jgi:hypothetical protein